MAYLEERIFSQQIAEQYCNLFDNNRELLSYYLSNQIKLNWFGRTIVGKQKVITFIVREMASTKHVLTSVEPTGPIQLQTNFETYTTRSSINDIRHTPISMTEREYDLTQENNLSQMKNLAFEDEDRKNIPGHHDNGNMSSQLGETDSVTCDTTIGDTVVSDTVTGNCNLTVHLEPNSSVILDTGQVNGFINLNHSVQRYFETKGSLQFCRTKQSPTSSKNLKLMRDTMKWERVCKLQIAYTIPPHRTATNEFEILLLVYDDTTRCRRNLTAEFDKIAS